MNRHKRLAVACAVCGRPFQARASDVNRGFGRACSRPCGGKLGIRPASHPFTEASHPLGGLLADKGAQTMAENKDIFTDHLISKGSRATPADQAVRSARA